MKCSECGAEVADEDKICGKCGALAREEQKKKEFSNMYMLLIFTAIVIIAILAYWIARPPNLSVSPDPPSFNFYTRGAVESGYQTMYVSNTGGGTLSWSVKTDQPWWIKIYPESGTDSGLVTVSINTAGLAPGRYKGTVTITSNVGARTGDIYLNLAPAGTPGQVGGQMSLAVGESWDVGNGWVILANAIDAKATPKQVWLTLSRDGNKLDDKVLSEGETYDYRDKIGTVFSVKVASIYAGPLTDMVTLTDVYY